MRVSVLTTTAVKSLAVHHPEQVELSAAGVVGDRAFFLIDEDGVLVSCTHVGDLLRCRAEFDPATGLLAVRDPAGRVHSAPVALGEPVTTDFYGLRTVDGNVVVGWNELFSRVAGRPVRLVQGRSGGFDVSGVTLIGTATVEGLGARGVAPPVDARRFRMNIEISGSDALDEDAWEGRRLRLGAAVVSVGGPVLRCAATTRNPDTGEVDLKTLQLIGDLKGRHQTEQFGVGFYLGVYAEVVVPGLVRVGDDVAFIA